MADLFYFAQDLKCGTAGERYPGRSELATLSAVATTALFCLGLFLEDRLQVLNRHGRADGVKHCVTVRANGN